MSDNILTEIPEDAFIPRAGVLLRGPSFMVDSIFDDLEIGVVEATLLSLSLDGAHEIQSEVILCSRTK